MKGNHLVLTKGIKISIQRHIAQVYFYFFLMVLEHLGGVPRDCQGKPATSSQQPAGGGGMQTLVQALWPVTQDPSEAFLTLSGSLAALSLLRNSCSPACSSRRLQKSSLEQDYTKRSRECRKTMKVECTTAGGRQGKPAVCLPPKRRCHILCSGLGRWIGGGCK